MFDRANSIFAIQQGPRQIGGNAMSQAALPNQSLHSDATALCHLLHRALWISVLHPKSTLAVPPVSFVVRQQSFRGTMPRSYQAFHWVLLSGLSMVSAQDVGMVRAKLGEIEVQAKISPKMRQLPSGHFKISAKIVVTNHGAQSVPFSNRDLFLRARSTQTARAYLNSIASHAIDFSSVQIEPNKPHSYSVYWILDGPEPPKIEILEIFIRRSYDAEFPKH